MAFIQYLTFDGTALPLPDSYEVQMDDVEADSGGETEAGTVQRDVVRAGVVSIPVTFSVSAKWLKILTEFKQQEKITVGYFDTETLAVKTVEMYVEGYKASLVKDTSRKGLWTVSFTLRNFRVEVMPYVPGERGVPAGGAGEHPEVLLDGEDNNCSWSRVSIYAGGYRERRAISECPVLRQFGDRTGCGVCGGDGDQPVPGH